MVAIYGIWAYANVHWKKIEKKLKKNFEKFLKKFSEKISRFWKLKIKKIKNIKPLYSFLSTYFWLIIFGSVTSKEPRMNTELEHNLNKENKKAFKILGYFHNGVIVIYSKKF